MPFDLNIFAQNIGEYGWSPSNKFDVTMTLPPLLQNNAGTYPYLSDFATLAPMRCSDCTTPGVIMMSNETYKVGVGPKIVQPYNAKFIPIKFTLLCDEASVIENTFNLWMGVIYGFSFDSTGQTPYATYLTNYRTDVLSEGVQINKYNREGKVIATYNLADAIPLALDSQSLSWSEENHALTLSIVMEYTSYTINSNNSTSNN